MTAIPLVPSWDTPTEKARGLFPLGDGNTIPGGWEPQPDRARGQISYDPKAIPTPFARAEATRLVLARIEETFAHELAIRFRLLLLGVAGGVLTLEPDDLRAIDEAQKSRFDNLGRALEQVDKDARYFCHVRANLGGVQRSYGITYRSSLFSPHARRADAEWNQLANEIRSIEPQTLELLADWRAVLTRAGRWAPDRGCDWQRGVDYVLGEARPSEGHARLRDHARLVGPVWLTVPTGRPEQPLRTEPVYLPALAPDWAKRFVACCRVQPTTHVNGSIQLLDPATKRTAATIQMPRGGADTDAVALGLGRLELHDVRVETAGELWINGRNGQPGLVDLLKPVVLALGAIDRPVTVAGVEGCPVLYPDPIRILFQRKLWPDAGGARDVQSVRLTDAVIRSGGILDVATIERAGGVTARLGSTAPAQLYVVDHLAGLPVLDLRAIGYVLWSVFVGEADVSTELGGQLALSENLEKLLVHTADRPLEPRDWVYRRVESTPAEALARRTATLSRLLLAYDDSEPGLPRIFAAAVRSFVMWAHGAADLMPLGRPARRIPFRLPTGDELTLAVDQVES